jgi:hypothetical protein
MHILDNQQSDTTIIAMLAKNEKFGWELLYDKYASMLYGIVLNMTGDEKVSGEILTDVFIQFRDKKMLSMVKTALCHSLIRHTYQLTIKYLAARGLTPISIEPVNGNYPRINSLYFELSTINEQGVDADNSKDTILKSLQAEFNQFRNHV